MDPDEFNDYLDSLPPGERQQAMADFGLMNANATPSSFGGDGGFGSSMMSPQLTPQSYDLGMMNQIPIARDYRGNPEPLGQDQIRDLYNGLQDFGAISLDPALAMYGGEGAFDPLTFKPTTIPVGDPLDMAGSRYVQGLAQSQGGYESYLAKKIMGDPANGIQPMAPSAAVAAMWAEINAAEGTAETTPEALQAKTDAAALKASLPPNTSADSVMGGSPMYQAAQQTAAGDLTTIEGRAAATNLDAINATASDLYERMVSDPQAGYTDPQTGLQYAAAYQQPSEMAQKFAEYGLPTPFDEYTDEARLPQMSQESLATSAGFNQAGQDRVSQATEGINTARSNEDLLSQAWADTEDQRATPPLDFGPLPTEPTAPEAQQSLQYVNPSSGQAYYNEPAVPQDQQADYDAAHEAWQAEMDFRNERPEPGTPNPYVISSGDKVLDTYDFGEGSREDQSLVAGTMESIYGAAGVPNVSVGAIGDTMATGGAWPSFSGQSPTWGTDFGQAVNDSWGDVQDAYDYQAQQHEMSSTPDAIERAAAMGTAAALQKAGRTPLNDALMQRSMGRATLSPYLSSGPSWLTG